MNPKKALIVVDYQNGFIPEHASGVSELPVEWWELLAPRINELMREVKTAGWLIIATRDWHPQNHVSFASTHPWKQAFVDSLENGQELWPDHCKANTLGGEYFSELDTSLVDHHIIKWFREKEDAYSGFEGKEDTPEGKKLTEILHDARVELVKVVGLATDFCVRATAVDSVKNGFRTLIDSSAIAWVMVKSPEDTIAYLEKLREETWVEYV